jgi:LPS export ABC transporter protein LptC
VNDLDAIQKVTHDPNAPDESIKNLKVFYTDSGYARVQIYASLAETYNKPEHITKLKDGVRVDFYSSEGKIISTLTSINAEINYETGLMVVRDSVVLRNLEKKQYLETEELFYNQKDSTIYTEKNVVIKKEGKGVIGRGRGIRTTQFFQKCKILEPVGKIDMSED